MVYQQKVVLAGAVQAKHVGESNLNSAIPDFNPGGLSRTLNVSGLDLFNYRLTVGLDIAGTGIGEAVLGDYYAYLRHTSTDGINSQTRVLLDRVGKTESDPTGSLANGIQAIFSDTFSTNIQNLSDLNNESKLSGDFAPASILSNSDNGLSTMGSIGWNGTWTLFVEDQSEGSTGNLVSWFMQFEDLSEGLETVPPVPSGGGLEYQLSVDEQDWNTSNSMARIVGNQLEALSGTGEIYIRAKYHDSVDSWSASQTIELEKAEQTITFSNVGSLAFLPFYVSATATSGLPLTYSILDDDIATVDEYGYVTPIKFGSFKIKVTVEGNENYHEAESTESFEFMETPIEAVWGLAQLYSQNSTNAPTAGVKKGTNNYLYSRLQEAAASPNAQIQRVEISNSIIGSISLDQMNQLPNIGTVYTSFSNPPSYTSYDQATNGTPDGTYDFIGLSASNAPVTNTVVQWSNNLSNYPQQAPQIVGTNWVAQSLRLADPAASNTISWNAWTNYTSSNSARIRLQVMGRPAVSNSIEGGLSDPAFPDAGGSNSYASAGVENVLYEAQFDADQTNAVIPTNVFSTNQVYRVSLSFGELINEGNEPRQALAVSVTTTEFRVVTGPNYPPSNPEIIGAELGNIDVAPGQDVVGTLAPVQDSDADDTVTYSLPSATYPDSNDNDYFTISDGRLRKNSNFDYSIKPTFTISIRATDLYGLYSETAYVVSVTRAQTITFGSLTNKTYGDAAFDPGATAESGLTVTYTSSDPNVAEVTGSLVVIKAAGSTTITASQAGGESGWQAAETVEQVLTVEPKGLTIGAPSIASRGYNGFKTAGAVTVGTLSGFVTGETVTATATAADYSSANAGTYSNVVVTYTLQEGTGGGKASNYRLAKGLATGEVTAKELTVGQPEIASREYDGTRTAGLVQVGSLDGFASSESVTATAVAADYISSDVGTYSNVTVTYSLANGENGGLAANYRIADRTATGLITAKTLSSDDITLTAPTDLVFNGSPKDFTASARGIGEESVPLNLTYESKEGGGNFSSLDSAPHVAGEYRVTATATGNYGGSRQQEFTITKASSTINVAPTESPISSGQTLANSTLSGGTASVEGAFAFTTPTTAPSVGTSSQGVTFTPTDLANYTSATTTVDVTVIDSDLPIAGTDNFTAAPILGNVVKYAMAQLLENDHPSDPTLNPNDSRSLSITGVTNASSGSKVTRKGSWIIYEPNATAINAGSDTFTYTLSNGSKTAGGTVNISLMMPDFTVEVSIERVADRVSGGKTVTFAVSPEKTFEVQASSDLSNPQSWSVIAPAATSLDDGRLIVEDSSAGGSRFYRVKWLPFGAP